MKIVFARHGLYEPSWGNYPYEDCLLPMICFEPIGPREPALEFLSICIDPKPATVVCIQDDVPMGVWIEDEQAFPPMEVLYVSRGNGRRDWETARGIKTAYEEAMKLREAISPQQAPRAGRSL